MFAITRSLRPVAALVLFAAMQTAVAQSPTPQPQPVGLRNDCPVEPHSKAINPDVVECHAKFAPLPTIPPEINKGDPDHLEYLRTKGDEFLRMLDRPQACGKHAQVGPAEACAILVYVLDPEFRQASLPWTYIVKIYRTTHPPAARLRDTIVSVVESNNSEQRYGGASADGEVWQLLADQRAVTRCKLGASEFIRESQSASANRSKTPDKCQDTNKDARYRPVLLIGRGEASRVLNRGSIDRNFGPN